MNSLRIRLALAAVVLLVTGIAMALDPHGYKMARQLGREAAAAESENTELQAKVDRMQHKVEALRTEPQALERAAHESGYVHSDETLFELK